MDFGGVAISVETVIPKGKEWETFWRDNVHAREVYDISTEKEYVRICIRVCMYIYVCVYLYIYI